MISAVIIKEVRDIIISARFAISFGLSALLIILCFYAGATDYKLNLARYEAAKAENLRQLDGVTDWSEVRSTRIFLPPQPLASLVGGISNDIGTTAEIHGRGESSPTDSRFNENPIYAVFRFVDLEFIFGIVLSLFAMVLGYDAICGEKERGTLRLTFANSLPRTNFILGKIIGLMTALFVPLILAFAVGMLLLPLMNVNLSMTEWFRLALILITGFLFIGAFLILSILISTLNTRSSSSFLVLLVIWIAAALIIPRSAVLLAGRSVKVPSVDEILAQEQKFSTQLWDEHLHVLEQYRMPASVSEGDMQQTMAAFNEFMDSLTTERENKIAEFEARLDEERFNRQIQQQHLALGLARLSPASSMTLAFTSLAGSSLRLQNQFKSEALEYQNNFSQFLQQKTGRNLGAGAIMIRLGGDDAEKKKPIDPTELPVFNFRIEDLSESLSSALFDMGLLAVLSIVFSAVAFAAFLRYDLR